MGKVLKKVARDYSSKTILNQIFISNPKFHFFLIVPRKITYALDYGLNLRGLNLKIRKYYPKLWDQKRILTCFKYLHEIRAGIK